MSLTDALRPNEAEPKARPANVVNLRQATDREIKYAESAFADEIRALENEPKGSRNTRLFQAAANLGEFVGSGLLDETRVESALKAAAKTAGLGASEIRKTFASGIKRGKKNPRQIPPPKLEKTNGATKHDDVNPGSDRPTADDPLRGLKHLSAVAVYGRDAILTLATVAVVYLWKDIAVAGTIVLTAGPPGEGKTTLLFLVFAARANTGKAVSLLGREIQPAPAGMWLVLIEGEHSETSTARKLVKSLRLLGIDDAALGRIIIVARKAVRLGSPEWLDVQKLVAAGLVSDIGLDTVARVAPADGNDEREQVAIFDEVARTIELAPDDGPKPTCWAVSHTRKNGTTGELSDVAGSVQRTGQADSVLLIRGEKVGGRTVSTTVTFAKLREDPDEYPAPVMFTIEKDSIRVTDAAANMSIADDRPLEERILESLQVSPKTKNGLMQSMKRNWHDIDDALSNLFSAKSIRTGTTKIRGRDFRTYEVRETPIDTRLDTRRAVTPDEHPTTPDE